MRVGRWAFVLALAACGCGFGKRPYANDPLLRNGNGVWGDHALAAGREPVPRPEPEPPRAPTPTALPTREWEVVVRD